MKCVKKRSCFYYNNKDNNDRQYKRLIEIISIGVMQYVLLII